MKLKHMNKILDEDAGLFFYSVGYDAYHYSEFEVWCQEYCRGKWGTEQSMAFNGFVGDPALWFGWLYDKRDAMLFKLSFS